jgi:hypothetical protein
MAWNADEHHPFTPFPGTDAETFIQWKGTEVCLDFYCPCGSHGHIDATFAYYVQCAACKAVFEMGTQVKSMRIDPTTIPDGFNRVTVTEVNDD